MDSLASEDGQNDPLADVVPPLSSIRRVHYRSEVSLIRQVEKLVESFTHHYLGEGQDRIVYSVRGQANTLRYARASVKGFAMLR